MSMGLERRPLTASDARDWAALLNAIEAADGSDEFTSEQDQAEALSNPNRDYPRGSIAIYDGPAMIGYGALAFRTVPEPDQNVYHAGGVHPDYRARGLGAELLDWAERTAVPLNHERFPGRPMALSSGCLNANAAAVALHEQRGYQPVRWFHDMVRDLSQPIPEPVTDDQITITGYQPDMAEHARLIRNESFRDHWGSAETSPQSWAHFLATSAFRPGFSFLAYQQDEPLGMLMASEHEARQERTGRRDLYIDLVGTRAAARKRGIATALLATAMSAARAAGFDQASLGVDADSLTGAVGLYERSGFTVARTWTAYRKQLT